MTFDLTPAGWDVRLRSAVARRSSAVPDPPPPPQPPVYYGCVNLYRVLLPTCHCFALSVQSDGHYRTQLYIKPVAASIILPFDSAQPFKMKKAVAQSQFKRALRVSSDPTSAKRSMDKIHSLFRANGYPSRWLNGLARQVLSKHHNRDATNTTHQPSRRDRIFIALPFIDDTLTRRVDAALKGLTQLSIKFELR